MRIAFLSTVESRWWKVNSCLCYRGSQCRRRTSTLSPRREAKRRRWEFKFRRMGCNQEIQRFWDSSCQIERGKYHLNLCETWLRVQAKSLNSGSHLAAYSPVLSDRLISSPFGYSHWIWPYVSNFNFVGGPMNNGEYTGLQIVSDQGSSPDLDHCIMFFG